MIHALGSSFPGRDDSSTGEGWLLHRYVELRFCPFRHEVRQCLALDVVPVLEFVTSLAFQKAEKSEKFKTFKNYYVFCFEKKNHACIHHHVVFFAFEISKVRILFSLEKSTWIEFYVWALIMPNIIFMYLVYCQTFYIYFVCLIEHFILSKNISVSLGLIVLSVAF